jgi:glutamyl-tRNA synthetase
MNSFSKTRIAPTPSGYLHLGNVFSFALTASLARKTGASILLRIDDLDQQRIQPQYVQNIFDTLQFLDITYDEGPRDINEKGWSQMDRMPLYENAMAELRSMGQVFACNCSRAAEREKCNCKEKNISPDEPGNAWRLITPSSLPETMQEFIIKKKDGFPSYQLGCVVDDQHFGIDLIVRGDDLRDSSIAQVYLAKVLGYTTFINSTIIHHKLLMESEDQKLSKSAGSTSLQYLIQHGTTAREIFQQIGKLAGSATPLNHWQDLANLVEIQ